MKREVLKELSLKIEETRDKAIEIRTF